eukprot:19597-Heterococcus_DN1.PRE.1
MSLAVVIAMRESDSAVMLCCASAKPRKAEHGAAVKKPLQAMHTLAARSNLIKQFAVIAAGKAG